MTVRHRAANSHRLLCVESRPALGVHAGFLAAVPTFRREQATFFHALVRNIPHQEGPDTLNVLEPSSLAVEP